MKVYLYPTNGAWVVMVWDGEHDVARWPDTQEGGALSGALLAAAEMAEKFCAANKQRWADFASAVIAGDDGTEMYWQTVKKNLAKFVLGFRSERYFMTLPKLIGAPYVAPMPVDGHLDDEGAQK